MYFLILAALLITTTGAVRADPSVQPEPKPEQPPVSSQELNDLRSAVTRLEATVGHQSKALESVDDRLRAAESWSRPSTVIALGAVCVSFVGLGISVWQSKVSRNERRNAAQAQRAHSTEIAELQSRHSTEAVLLESLKWFGGGIQNRAIGVAVVNGNWRGQPGLRTTWHAVLLNQAVYIIGKPDRALPDHEMQNLRNIIGMLAEPEIDAAQHLAHGDSRGTLNEAFDRAQSDIPREDDGRVVRQADRTVIRDQLTKVATEFRPFLHPAKA